MPNLKKGEDKSSYVSRCIADLIKEGYSSAQAAAICYSKYKEEKASSYLKKDKK